MSYIRSEETRRKMSIAAKNRSEETRRKMSIAAKNRVYTPERRKKMSESMKIAWAKPNSKLRSKESTEKRRKAQLGDKGSNWQGGIDDDCTHKRMREKYGTNYCRLCGMTIEDYQLYLGDIRNFAMHCRDGDYGNDAEDNWMSLCEYLCHRIFNLLDYYRRYIKWRHFHTNQQDQVRRT